MFFDNIILLLNVLEQFAIRVTIFDLDIETVLRYVNKLYFNNNDDFIQSFIKNQPNDLSNINPTAIIKEAKRDMDRKIITDDLFNEHLFTKLKFQKDIHFRFIY